jgi:hypothetical protein
LKISSSHNNNNNKTHEEDVGSAESVDWDMYSHIVLDRKKMNKSDETRDELVHEVESVVLKVS